MDLRQLLSQGYQAADRFLPFDGVLDPMFAPPPRRQMPQDVGAMPNTQSRFAPQQAAPMPQQAVPQLAMPQPASNPFAMPVPKKGGGFGRTIMEFVDPSFNRRADERSAAIAGRERQAQLFATIYPIIKDDPREVAALMLNPEEYGKNLAERYGADVVNQGDLLTFGGKPQTYNPATYQSGDQLFQTKQGGGFTDPVRRAPSFDETTARQRLEFDMSKPQIVTTSPGQDVVAVNPGAPGAIPLTGMSVATPELLAATNYQESRGRRDAISPKGAAGPMQVMPGTARDLARRFGQNFDGLTDEQVQTRMMAGPEPGQTTSLGERMGEAYMNDQLKAFGGNVPLALAAYNAGPGKAAEWAKAYGRPGENVSLADWVAKIPFGETRDYISKILGGNAGPSAQVVASGGAKPQYRPATADEKVRFGVDPNLPYKISPDGNIELISTGGLTPQQVAKDGVQLRQQFNALPDVKDFNNVATSYSVIERLASQPPSGPGDMSLIFAYMKMLDPGSVVREGEFANAQNAASVPDQIRNQYNRAASGQKLNPKQRREFTDQARNIYTTHRERYDQLTGEYKGYAVALGLDPDIITPRAPPKPPSNRTPVAGGRRPIDALAPVKPKPAQQALAPPKVGDIRKGYRFKGGDFTDPKSWVKL